MHKELMKKIESREAVVGIIGLGYVGLPLLLEFSRARFHVIGFDIDEAKTKKLARGDSYLAHIPASSIAEARDRGNIETSTDFSRLAETDVIIICVPTPLTATREPDLSYVATTATDILNHLHRGQLIVLESTSYPGTTDEFLREILERNGLIAGKDFFLAFSPEREDPGNAEFSLNMIPKIVGGFDPASLELARELYETVTIETVPVSSTRTAEAVKLTENIYRSVNIALVNELKMIFDKMDIDIWEVIEAAKTKPFGFTPFYPGPGLGGHCIPIDPYYLSWVAKRVDSPTRFIELAGEINTAMPDYVVSVLIDALNEREKSLKGSKILLVGLAYKKDIDDSRESPALKLFHIISTRGGKVDFFDPLISEFPVTRKWSEYAGIKGIDWDTDSLKHYDAIVIVTDHSGIDYHALVKASQLVIDCRNATRDVTVDREKIVKA